MASQQWQVDLTECDREPIHQLGAIQPIGFLIAVCAEWRVRHVSDNVEGFLGMPPASLIGRDLGDVVDRDALHAIRNVIFQIDEADVVGRLFNQGLIAGQTDRRFDCAVHVSGDMIVIEAEPSAVADASEAAGLVRAMIGRLEATRTLTDFFHQGAVQVQVLTGFDRVMVYAFAGDGSGEVVAEVARRGTPSLLGLHFPATDIPQQARTLYLRTPFRIICDIDAVPARILSAPELKIEPLDLSLSILRSVSPVHIAYLRNMGVSASLSISIIVEGRLWGMFACHHFAARQPSFEMRTLAELFAQMFAMKLEARERSGVAGFEKKARDVADTMMAAIARDVGLLRDADWMARTIADIMPCDGAAIRLDGRTAQVGLVPAQRVVEAIAARANALGTGEVFATDHLAATGLFDHGTDSDVAGVLAIPISSTPRDYAMLFRRPVVRTVTWAGDPRKAAVEGQLSPRASFAAWSEEVRDRAAPFTEQELRAADAVRASLIDVVLRLNAAASVERERATEQQEVLIAELNHRVRNILALISGLIMQSQDAATSLADYTSMLEGRIQALARAHDQITNDNWAPASLTRLFETEGASPATRERLTLSGLPVLLEPAAFTTVTLVVHELMTNSLKYGALSTNGRVLVTWSHDAAGNLDLRWSEEGGPKVERPRRQGLGTTIIERAIPYDLGGTATIDYAETGIQARFVIPAAQVTREAVEPPKPAPETIQLARIDQSSAAPQLVLLVEDSLIISLHVRDMLASLGVADVIMAASVAEAFTELDRSRPTFAILDINLGAETSLPIADRLRGEGIPFVFATGYGKRWRIPDVHREVPVVQKPYNRANLGATMGL